MSADDGSTNRDEPSEESPERIQYEWGDEERPSTAIIEAVAATTDREPTALPRMNAAVDVDAVDTLLTEQSARQNGSVHVSFTYATVDVSVTSDGRIELQPENTARE